MISAKQTKTISVPVKEYNHLKDVERRFEKMRKLAIENYFETPSTRNADEVISDMKKTGHYNASFLKSLKKGLGESEYFAK